MLHHACNHPSSDEWRDWLATHTAKLLLYARQQTRCAADAEDVCRKHLSSRGSTPVVTRRHSPCFATIRRRAIDHARSADRRTRREQDGEPEPWFAPEIEPRETQRILEESVKNLTPIYREVVTLKVWGGLTFQEIADAVGVPLNTAASRYLTLLRNSVAR